MPPISAVCSVAHYWAQYSACCLGLRGTSLLPERYNHAPHSLSLVNHMNYLELIESMTPEVYESLKRAVELGKWPDGRRLSAEQREECLQAIIAWGNLNLPEEQRVGYMSQRCKSADSAAAESSAAAAPRHWPE